MKNDRKFQWTEEAVNAFKELKQKLVTAPILRYPQFDKEYIISTFPLVVYLVKCIRGRNFLSGRALQKNELKWHISDKEGFALVERVQHFRHYLANNKFRVFTANVSCKYLQNIKDCQGGAYSFRVTIWNKTQTWFQNHTADYLSQQPYTDTNSKESNDLADHAYSIQTPKMYTEVTLVYSDEDETVVATATEPAMLPVDI